MTGSEVAAKNRTGDNLNCVQFKCNARTSHLNGSKPSHASYNRIKAKRTTWKHSWLCLNKALANFACLDQQDVSARLELFGWQMLPSWVHDQNNHLHVSLEYGDAIETELSCSWVLSLWGCSRGWERIKALSGAQSLARCAPGNGIITFWSSSWTWKTKESET